MRKVFVFAIAVSLLPVFTSVGENLYSYYKDYPKIRVYLKEVNDYSGHAAVSRDEFRNVFSDVMEMRVQMMFVLVDSADEADIVVNASIQRYVFTEKAAPSLFDTALSAGMSEPRSAARLTVDYEVLDPVSGKRLLAFEKFATDLNMPRERMRSKRGYINAAHKNIKRFIYRAFYKERS